MVGSSAATVAEKFTAAKRLLNRLRKDGFFLREGKTGELLVSPASRLTDEDRKSITALKGHLLGLLWEETEAYVKAIREGRV